MATAYQYENDAERNKHSEAIRTLAEKLGVPEEQIRGLYEENLLNIKQGARIKDYLIILVSRHVRDSIGRGSFQKIS